MPTKRIRTRVVDPTSSSNNNPPEETAIIPTTNHPAVVVKVKQTRRRRTNKTKSSPTSAPPSTSTTTTEPPPPSPPSSTNELHLTTSLQILDPLLQFLTRATGRTLVPLQSLRGILPPNKHHILSDFPALHARSVLHIHIQDSYGCHETGGGGDEYEYARYFGKEPHADDANVTIGFIPPQTNLTQDDGTPSKKKALNLHGSTKAAAKRRIAALKKSLKQNQFASFQRVENESEVEDDTNTVQTKKAGGVSRDVGPGILDGMVHNAKYKHLSVRDQYEQTKKNNEGIEDEHSSCLTGEGLEALDELQHLVSHGLSEKKGGAVGGKVTAVSQNYSQDMGKEKPPASQPFILKKQAAFAGSHKARIPLNEYLSDNMRNRIPTELADVMNLQLYHNNDDDEQEEDDDGADANCLLNDDDTNNNHSGSSAKRRIRLYSHQATAIESALSGIHTLVCTGTGSGKSLCFLLPILAQVMSSDLKQYDNIFNENDSVVEEFSGCCTALLLFPTKALAQDQLSKLLLICKSHPLLEQHIRPGVIDGDTPHPQRSSIARHCNIILSNPDTLHAAILPQWKGIYKGLLAQLKFVVVDELHIYEGTFGAHVSLVLSRLYRVCCIAKYTSTATPSQQKTLTTLPIFIGCSATICHPEEHFRLLCPIPSEHSVRVLTQEEDGSPCGAKHFFVWNPPLLDNTGGTKPSVVDGRPQSNSKSGQATGRKRRHGMRFDEDTNPTNRKLNFSENLLQSSSPKKKDNDHQQHLRRTHAADETGRVLAQAVKVGIRCIAFCKTRMLAEWVYERCVTTLRSDSATADLCPKVEVYRGGYSASIRRDIENRLFRNELFGVVATSALELGVDIGGIDLTLHCGYPGSISSLMQQAGRAGRGGVKDISSFSIMICFSAPSEQHLWKYPKGLLSRGLDAPPSLPLNAGIVQGHLLCAGEEFPLVAGNNVTDLLYLSKDQHATGIHNVLSDHALFGSEAVYDEAVEHLMDRKHLWQEAANNLNGLAALSTHPSMKKPWMQVSLRSIEPISYSIVDMSHPRQGGKNDKVHDKAAVMDTIPYSRVFYHAYPGAIIMHRGNRYKIHSISMPPAFANCSIGYRYDSSNLGAFAKPTTARYSTRALSINHFTVVKQFHRVEVSKSLRLEGAALLKCGANNQDADLLGSPKSPCNIATSQDTQTNTKSMSIYPGLTFGCIAGSGVVNVKKTVHGYAKLSLVNRTELSRTEISVPPMEYDTNAMWIDAEASVLNEVMTDFDAGVHALSHAIVAVAPLFVPCTSSDIDCDHSRVGCTRVLLFDVRAGGAGTCAQLWKHFFKPIGVLDAAIDLLLECPSCSEMGSYKGGCPGCIQSVPCVNFQSDLNRTAGLHIARRMLSRLQQSSLYKEYSNTKENIISKGTDISSPKSKSTTKESDITSPRREKRLKALHDASDLVSARKRNIVVGRPTWPTDEASKITAEDYG